MKGGAPRRTFCAAAVPIERRGLPERAWSTATLANAPSQSNRTRWTRRLGRRQVARERAIPYDAMSPYVTLAKGTDLSADRSIRWPDRLVSELTRQRHGGQVTHLSRQGLPGADRPPIRKS